jgi:hypothetical protein
LEKDFSPQEERWGMSFWKKFFGINSNLPEQTSPELEIDESSDYAAIANSDTENEITEANTEVNESAEVQETESSAEETFPKEDQAEDSEEESSSEDANQINDSESEVEIVNDSPDISTKKSKKSLEDNLKTDVQQVIEDVPELSDEERLAAELKEAEEAALAAELEKERLEVFEDLTILDGRILPQLKVPDWRQELEFVKERYEPCDLSDHIVKVSNRRMTARQIDHELAQSRLNAYERYLERASRRFKDKIDEDVHLNKIKVDLSQWKSEQAKSVGWVLAERVNEEVVKAKQAELDATSFVENNAEFSNPDAIDDYRHFARRMFLIPITTIYLMSVIALTYSRFEWIIKFLPLFNLGLAKFQIMVLGVSSYFLIRNFWRYSRKVALIQRKLVLFNSKYQEQESRIKHAVKEHTRLSQQQPLLEPILQVLARGYRVQLQSDVMAKVHATTNFDTNTLPACVTLARANESEESKMIRLRQRALAVLMTPGWRTRGLNEIAKVHAESRMLNSAALALSSLETDSMLTTSSSQKMLLEAFSNTEIHERVSQKRLVQAIEEIHKEVLANFNSEDRPRVNSLRDNGFDKLAFRTSWLVDDDGSEDWIPFLTEILTEETSPFGLFNIQDRRSGLANKEEIKSVAVVPQYFNLPESNLKALKSDSSEVMPLDITVRVDVSPWADPSAFAVFADDTNGLNETEKPIQSEIDPSIGGLTGA